MRLDWNRHGIDITQVRGGKGYCPKCHATRKNKRDKSLSVDLNTGLFNCHNSGCGFSGTAVVFEPKKEYVKPLPRLQKVSDKVVEWFKGRGISNNTLLALNVTEAKEYIPKDEKEVNCICFNYYRGEELVNIKFRSGSKGFKMSKDAELIFYNLNALQDRTEVVITEGEIDCLTFWECGIANVVSVPNGASSGSAKLEYLDNCWRDFEHLEKIVIAVDGDEAGQALKEELIRRLGRERCYEVKYPEGCKDANEVLLKLGKEAVKELYEKAEALPVEAVETVYDKLADVMRLYRFGYPKTSKILFEKLNEFIRWKLGELTVVTGIPNHGKSTWLNNVLVQLANLHGWKFAMFTPEKQPSEILISELCSIYIGKPFYRANESEKMSQSELEEALNFVDQHFFIIKTDEVNATPDGLISKFTEMVKRYGINGAVADPWNYLEHNYDDKTPETKFVSDSLTKFAAFCKKYSVHTFIVAHPTKMQKDKDGNFNVPDLYSISGSAHFKNKADNGITVYRDFTNNHTTIHVQKVRWFYVGKVGTVTMYFDVHKQQYSETMPLNTAEFEFRQIEAPDNPYKTFNQINRGLYPTGDKPFG